jgi:hypothetical protein
MNIGGSLIFLAIMMAFVAAGMFLLTIASRLIDRRAHTRRRRAARLNRPADAAHSICRAQPGPVNDIEVS